MTRTCDRRSSGVTRLEIVFGVMILCLVAGFALLMKGREDRPDSTDDDASGPAVAHRAGPGAHAPRGAGGDAFDEAGARLFSEPGEDDAGAGGEWDQEWAEPAPVTLRVPDGVPQRNPISAPAALRAYYAEALAVAGQPDWDRFVALSRKLEPAQFAEAWSLLQEQPWSRAKEEAARAFVTLWAGRDPRGALEFADTLGSRYQRHALYATAIETWARLDAEAALAWFAERESEGSGHRVSTHLVAGLYAAAPEMALDLVWQMEDSHRQAGVLRELFLSSTDDRERRQGVAQLKDLFDRSEDPARRALLANMVADAWADEDPMRVIAWAAELADEPDVQESVLMSAAQAWGRREPGAVMDWLERQDVARVPPYVLESIARSWTYDNPAELRQWIERTPPSRTRDAVITTSVNTLQRRHPAEALRMAEAISQENERYQAMRNVADRWMRYDRNAAAAAVLASSMPTAMKRKYAMRVIPADSRPSSPPRSSP